MTECDALIVIPSAVEGSGCLYVYMGGMCFGMDWNDRYIEDELPWETGRVDKNLPAILARFQITPCATLELGCGTGNNAIWLARHGFDVTAVDLSGRAIERALEKARSAEVAVCLLTKDIVNDDLPAGPFSFVFDRGCFHSFDGIEIRRMIAEKLRDRMANGGYWLSLIGSADDAPRDVGPPRLTALEVVSAVEPYFELISLESSELDSDRKTQPRAWCCLMRKRS